MSTKTQKTTIDAAVIIIAIAVAIAGFVALFSGPRSAASPTATEGVVAAEPALDPVAAPATQQAAPATQQLVEQSISPAVIRTLAAQGSAWFLPTDQAMQMLPTSIVNVLESRGVVLQVQLGAG